MDAIDVARARSETPGCAHVAHFNNAGAALPPQSVLDTVVDHLQLEAQIGGYEAADARAQELESVYASLARLLGCSTGEVAVVDSATRAWDMAFYAFRLEEGDRVLTTHAEYASNYIALKQRGLQIDVVPDDESGQVDVDALASMLDGRVKLVSLVHVPSQGGLVQPAAAVGALTRAAGVPLLLDACQSVGQMPIDVGELGCDILSAPGRKFLRGPRGTGFLYVRRELVELLEPPMLDLHAAEWQLDGSYVIRPDARRFESWEANSATKLGLGAAVEYALGWGLEAIRDRVYSLAAELRERLGALGGVTVHDLGRERCGIVTFAVDGVDADAALQTLRAQRINVSVSPGTYARLDLARRGIESLVRASVHYYNDEAELERLVDAVARLRAS
jgi:cysteine desulfurase/selenocysteine lyase